MEEAEKKESRNKWEKEGTDHIILKMVDNESKLEISFAENKEPRKYEEIVYKQLG
jgi:hypothetical protein